MCIMSDWLDGEDGDGTKYSREVEREAKSLLPQLCDVVARHMRKLADRQSYSREQLVWRSKINFDTGEVKYRKRKVHRKTRWMRSTRGFLRVDDGVAAAGEIARLLAFYVQQTGYQWPEGQGSDVAAWRQQLGLMDEVLPFVAGIDPEHVPGSRQPPLEDITLF